MHGRKRGLGDAPYVRIPFLLLYIHQKGTNTPITSRLQAQGSQPIKSQVGSLSSSLPPIWWSPFCSSRTSVLSSSCQHTAPVWQGQLPQLQEQAEDWCWAVPCAGLSAGVFHILSNTPLFSDICNFLNKVVFPGCTVCLCCRARPLCCCIQAFP